MDGLKIKLYLFIYCLLLPSYSFAALYKLSEDKRNISEVVLTSSKSQIHLSFNLNAFETSKAQEVGFSEIKFEGLETQRKVGAPTLPMKSFLVSATPEDISYAIKKDEEKNFSHILPMPAQKEKCRCIEEWVSEFSWNKSLYRDEGSQVEVQYLGDFKGTPISRVSVFPASYSAQKGLSVFPQMSVTFELKKGKLIKQANQLLSQKEFNNKYLVISPQSLSLGLEKFVAHKGELGFDVTVVELETIGSTYEEVKAYIHGLFSANKDAYSYVLLVGHEEIFPTHYVSTTFDSKTPSDLGYFTFGGEGDLIPDVFSGRIVADSQEEVERQVQKIIDYEQGRFSGRGDDQVIGIASNEGANPSDKEYIEQMLAPLVQERNKTPFYLLQDNDDSNASVLVEKLSQGAYWLNYIGHGSGFSWSSMTGENFRSEHIKNIDGSVHLPVIIDVACQNGRFSYDNHLGERFMNETNAQGESVGAVAYYGGSVNISWHPPAIMAVGINKEFVEKKLSHLGEILLAGQLYLLENYNNQEAAEENLKWYHLFGDPSLALNL